MCGKQWRNSGSVIFHQVAGKTYRMKKILIGLIPLIGLTAQAQKPNVLILFADDQRADAVCWTGNTYIETHNIDKLAEVGVRFSISLISGSRNILLKSILKIETD